jgi:hypothetical protein
VAVHVHDLGRGDGQVPHPGLALVPSGGTADLPASGRGLGIVAEVSAWWGTRPAAWCPCAAAGDPAVAAGGRCTWCRLPAGEGVAAWARS